MLYAYMDESGHESKLCVLGGFVGSESQWDACVSDWRQALKPRQHIHMTDLRWNSKPRRVAQLLSKLGPIPRQHGLMPVIGIVHRLIYDATAGRNEALVASFSPWFFAFRKVVIGLRAWVPKNHNIKLIFERQDKFSPVILEIWNRLKLIDPTLNEKFSGIEFVEKGITQLEPADYLAFQYREFFTDKTKPSQKAKMGMSIMEDDVIGGEYTMQEMKDYSRYIATNVLLSALHSK